MYFAPPKNSLSIKGTENVNATFPNLTHQETVVVMVNDASKKYFMNGSMLCLNAEIQEQLQQFTT